MNKNNKNSLNHNFIYKFSIDLLKFLFKYWKFIIKSQEGYIFITLFNLTSIVINSKVRVKYINNSYEIKDSRFLNLIKRSNNQSVLVNCYLKGFKNRTFDLQRCYQLNKIPFKNDDIIFDCGANNGDLKLWFDIRGIKVNYCGFEPDPSEYKNLIFNVSPSKCFNIGCWEENLIMNFYISRFNADSSFIKPPHYEEVKDIEVKRLDNFVTKKIKLLKLEGEGAEFEILKGLGEKIELIEYISADLGFERGINQESTLPQVVNYLLNRNFKIISIGEGRIALLFKNMKY